MQANNYDDFPPGLDMIDMIFAEPAAEAAVGAELPNGLADNREHWRSVDGYLNYEVSSHGHIRNARTGRVLRPNMVTGYMQVKLSRAGTVKTFSVHRLVAEAWIPNPDNKPQVDHIDNDKENNVLQNLRWCTAAQNMQNRGLRRDNRSGYTGVFQLDNGRWRASITTNGERIHLGVFDTAEEARDARDQAALVVHGEFANLN